MRENDQNLGGAQRCGPQNTCPLIQFTIESAAKAGQLLNLTHFHHVLPVARVVFSFCLCRVAKGSSTSFLQWQKNLCISTLLLYFITHLQILFAKHRKPDHNLMMKYWLCICSYMQRLTLYRPNAHPVIASILSQYEDGCSTQVNFDKILASIKKTNASASQYPLTGLGCCLSMQQLAPRDLPDTSSSQTICVFLHLNHVNGQCQRNCGLAGAAHSRANTTCKQIWGKFYCHH